MLMVHLLENDIMKLGKKSKHLLQLYRPPLLKKYKEGYTHLDHNESPFSALQHKYIKLKNLNNYPDPFHLYQTLIDYYNVGKNNILLTRGSEQGIQYTFHSFLNKKDVVLFPNPSFGMFDVFAHQNNAKVKYIDYTKHSRVTVDVIKKFKNISLLVLANPDNPTGKWIPYAEIKKIVQYCKKNNIWILLDEAYYEFYPLHTLSLIYDYENLIITRTFSKAWGLASIRVGLVFAHQNTMELLKKWKYMDEIDSLAISVLDKIFHDTSIVEKNVQQVHKWQSIFKEKFPKQYIDTKANFILMNIEHTKLIDFKLRERNIIIRTNWNHPVMNNKIRFSISDDKIMKIIFKTLTNYYQDL